LAWRSAIGIEAVPHAVTDDRPAYSKLLTVLTGSAALLVVGIQPLLLEELVKENRCSEIAIGIVAAIEILAIGLGSVAGMRLLSTMRVARLACLAGSLLAAANLITISATGLGGLITTRMIAGLAAGGLVAIPLKAIERSHHPGRLGALFLVGQTLAQLMAASNANRLHFGGSSADGLFVLMAIAAGMVVLFSGYLAPVPASPSGAVSSTSLRPSHWLALASIAASLGGVIAIWSYLGVAIAATFPGTPSNTAVAVCLLFQILGAATAAAIGDRGPVLSPSVVICDIEVLIALALGRLAAPVMALLLPALFGFVWLYGQALHTRLLVAVDPTRRTVAYLAAAQLAGAALGPALVSAVGLLGARSVSALVPAALLTLAAAGAIAAISGTQVGPSHQ
jgi:MFS transporter, DHA1 family, inner membrane transport protein